MRFKFSMMTVCVTALLLTISCSYSPEQTLCISESSMRENNAMRTPSVVVAEARNIILKDRGVSQFDCILTPNTKINYQITNRNFEKNFEVIFASEHVTVNKLEKGVFTLISEPSQTKSGEASISTITPGVAIILDITTPPETEGSYEIEIVPRTSAGALSFRPILITLIVLIIAIFVAGFVLWKIRKKEAVISGRPGQETSASGLEEQSIQQHDFTNQINEELRIIGEKILSMESSIETSSILRKQKGEIEKSLTNYINGYNFSILKIAITDWIDAYELAIEASNHLKENEDLESRELESFLTAITSYLRQGLEIAGVEQFTPEIGDLYQTEFGVNLMESIPAEDPQDIGKIAETRRPGWKTRLPENQADQQVIREAQVVVYN